MMRRPIVERPDAFEPKDALGDGLVLPGARAAPSTGEAAKARLADGWDTFAMEGHGIRCVSDEPWVTASETAECALAYAAIGDRDTAVDLAALDRAPTAATTAPTGPASSTTRQAPVRFPFDEHTSYTAAAVILAADAITAATPAARLFRAPDDFA